MGGVTMCACRAFLRGPRPPASSPMTTALTVSRMKAFRRRKRSTCSRVMVCRRRRVRSALCCRLSCSRCSQPTRPSRWPLSRRNRLFPWLLMVYLRGTEGPSGKGQDRGRLWGQGKGRRKLARNSENPDRGGAMSTCWGEAVLGHLRTLLGVERLPLGRKGSRSPESVPGHDALAIP